MANALVAESFGAQHRLDQNATVEIKPLESVTPLASGPLVRQEQQFVPLSAGLRGDRDIALEADKRMVQLLMRIGAVETLWSGFLSNPVVPLHLSRPVSKVFERSMEWANRVFQDFKRKGAESMTDSRADFFGRLEQLQIASAAFLDLYGSAAQREKATFILLWDLENNTGLHRSDPSIQATIADYRRAYAMAGRLRPVQFERFGDLMESISAHIVANHPKHIPALRGAIVSKILNGEMSFSAGFLDVVKDNPSAALAIALNHSPHGPHDAEDRLRAMNTFNLRMLKLVEELRIKATGAEEVAA